ncbi:hypothetical protein [Gordonia rhizosphera]|uniref:Uncharacterized protein n=1 Tax=Gordonia rhizosphera NBRC 16068 TaxID=1108045 RepID=K6WSZ5_9ACTN|nr:hypothetical protein [Gordonia rhizosphera]GAB89679.1 hypothetical protein GORHZ_069_00580 [Gordonia rhizosphera NBRC 16068]
MTSTPKNDRAERFAQELDRLKIPDPAKSRSQMWIRLGVAGMILGVALGIIAYLMSHNTSDPLVQRDALTLALTGIAVAVVSSAVFLRYSLTNFLRFWLARQAFDLNAFGEQLTADRISVVENAQTRPEKGLHDDHRSAAIARG